MKEEEELEDEEILTEDEDDEEEVEVEETEEEGDEDEEEDDEEVVEEEFDIEEDVNALLEGEELSEEFQEKAKIIFETALKSKVSQIKESLEQQYAVALVEEVEEIKTILAERVDSYLEYVACLLYTSDAADE